MSNKDDKKLYNWRLYVLTSDLPATTSHVLLTLSMHMNPFGESAFPTTDQLAYETRLSRQAIIKHLKSAEEKGWITRKLLGLGDQRWRSMSYEPAIPRPAKLILWKDSEAYKSAKGRQSRRKKTPEGGNPDIPPQEKGGNPKSIKAVILREEGGNPKTLKAVNEDYRSNSFSNSNSKSISNSGTGQEKKPAKSTATWQAYSAAYRQRHQVDPVRNKKINSQLCQLVDRVGEDNAPAVAEFYVWHNNGFYVQRMHAVDLLLKDAESLHAQWQQGKQMTQTQARQADKTQSNLTVVQSVIEKRQVLEHEK